MLTAGKQINGIDRVVRRLNPNKPCRDFDVPRPDSLLDDVHRLHFDQLGSFYTCAGRRAEAELKLLRFDVRKDLRADSRIDDDNQGDGRHEVTTHHKPAKAKYRLEPIAVPRAQLLEESSVAVAHPEHPGGQHRHQRAGQHKRGNHREPDRERQRDEQLAADARHEERRDEHGQDAEHREEPRHDGLLARFDDSARPGHAGGEVRMNVLDFHGSFIDEDSHGERQPT